MIDRYKKNDDGELRDLNSLRYKQFCRGIKSESLPPTRDALEQHVKRVNLQVFVWLNSTTATPPMPDPIGNGWKLEDNTLCPVWMTQPAAPDFLIELVRCGCKAGCTKNCRCKKESLACTASCLCAGDETCQNPYKYGDDSSDDSDNDDDA